MISAISIHSFVYAFGVSPSRSQSLLDALRQSARDTVHTLFMLGAGAVSVVLGVLIFFLVSRYLKSRKVLRAASLPGLKMSDRKTVEVQKPEIVHAEEVPPVVKPVPEEEKKEEPLVVAVDESRVKPDSGVETERVLGMFLPDAGMMNRNLPDHFVFYKPQKDIGVNFCWSAEIPYKNGNLFAVHTGGSAAGGLSGAMESMVNMVYLRDAVVEKSIGSPDLVLSSVNEKMTEFFRSSGDEVNGYAGMNGLLCIYDIKGGWLRFAGSGNPLWLIRNEEVKEFLGNINTPASDETKASNTNLQTLGLRKGDCIYTFTKGSVRRKEMIGNEQTAQQQLMDFLRNHHTAPMKTQGEMLHAEVQEWMKRNEAFDGMLVTGVRI